jgi:hypothetical protein
VDLSRLSDADLMALKSGDLSKVSDEGLAALKGVQAAPQAPQRTPPSNMAVANNAGWKGLASIPDAILNTPTNVANLAKAAVGQIPLALDRPDLAPRPTEPPNYARGFLERMGMIRPDAEPANPEQRMLDAGVQGAATALVSPGRSIPQALTSVATGGGAGVLGQATTEATESPTAGAIASMATPFAVQAAGAAGRSRLAQATLERQRNAVRDQTLAAGQQEGYVIPPSTVNPSGTNKVLESIAGKEATKQEASKRNQPVTMDLAARELGLPPGTALTRQDLDAYRAQVSKPYGDLAALSPRADSMLFQLREARQQARQYYNFYERSADPNALANAKMLDTKTNVLEKGLEHEANRLGRPDLVPQMREARKQIAKSREIESALNIGSGDVDARVIGRAMSEGSPMTGGLATMGRFAEGFRPFVQEAASTPTPGVSKLGAYGGMVMGGQMAGATQSPAGFLAAGIPMVSGPVRDLLLSQAYQKRFAQPNYNQGQLLGQIPQLDPMLQSLLLGQQATNQ